MDRRLVFLPLVAIGALFVSFARSDYVIPPFPEAIAEVTSIVDATVVEHLDRGRVRIEIHETLKGGDPPTILAGARYTCLGIDLTKVLQVGTRYVFLLSEGGLYEEGSFYETRREGAALQCRCWDGSDDFTRRWMPVAEFERLVSSALRRP